MYVDEHFWIEVYFNFVDPKLKSNTQIYGVNLTAKSDVNINGQGFIQVEIQKLFQLLKLNVYKSNSRLQT